MSKEVGHNLAGWVCSESFLRLQVKCWWKAVINRLDWSGRTHFQDEWITIYTYKLCSDFVSCILGLPWKPRKGKIIQISVPMYPESSFTRLTQRTMLSTKLHLSGSEGLLSKLNAPPALELEQATPAEGVEHAFAVTAPARLHCASGPGWVLYFHRRLGSAITCAVATLID